jgi:hypothetical protein
MKKLILLSMLALMGFVANANQKVTINNMLPPCQGMVITVTFNSYMESVCTFDVTSPTYTIVGGEVFDMCDPSTWAPAVLAMPSYETFAATICVTCPGMVTPYCITVGLDCNPPHACFPVVTPPTPFKGCCFGSLAAECVQGGGGTCMQLNIHP